MKRHELHANLSRDIARDDSASSDLQKANACCSRTAFLARCASPHEELRMKKLP